MRRDSSAPADTTRCPSADSAIPSTRSVCPHSSATWVAQSASESGGREEGLGDLGEGGVLPDGELVAGVAVGADELLVLAAPQEGAHLKRPRLCRGRVGRREEEEGTWDWASTDWRQTPLLTFQMRIMRSAVPPPLASIELCQGHHARACTRHIITAAHKIHRCIIGLGIC